jgi:hypothetical protein
MMKSVSVRIYRALLVAYPKTFRENYVTHMVWVFRDLLRDEYYRNRTSGVIDLWFRSRMTDIRSQADYQPSFSALQSHPCTPHRRRSHLLSLKLCLV